MAYLIGWYERLFQADINIATQEINEIYYNDKEKELLASADHVLSMKNEFKMDDQPSFLDIYIGSKSFHFYSMNIISHCIL